MLENGDRTWWSIRIVTGEHGDYHYRGFSVELGSGFMKHILTEFIPNKCKPSAGKIGLSGYKSRFRITYTLRLDGRVLLTSDSHDIIGDNETVNELHRKYFHKNY